MGEWIYEMVYTVFGNGLAESLNEWMVRILDYMELVFEDQYSVDLITIFMSIAASLMIVYFFQNLIDQASRDMFSLEKLIVAFIKLLVAFILLMYLPDILSALVKLAKAFNEVVIAPSDSGIIVDEAISGNSLEDYDHYFKRAGHWMAGAGCLSMLIIPYILCFFAELIGQMLIASAAVMFIVKAIFSPIGIVQVFDEGTRSSGMRYLKSLFAEAINFSVILAIIIIAGKLSAGVYNTVGGTVALPSPEELSKALSIPKIIPLVIFKLVIAGGMASGSKIAHDIMGA